ncbi:MAG: hypothetical protein SGBAC_008773 [Bacillariaceae sp.]
MADEFTEEYFVTRIAELKEQIAAAFSPFESSQTFMAHDEVAQAHWASFTEYKRLEEAKNKAPKEERDALAKQQWAQWEAYETLKKETWPDRMDKGDAIFAELDPTLKELENAIMECAILTQTEPARLAEWGAESGEHRELWKAFMEDKELQKKMILNGGAANGKYHKSVEIHADVTKNLDNDAPNEVFDKIALAIALELAEPIQIFKQQDKFVDPVERFWHYANAHTYNFLDKHFAGLKVWELRNVVNSDATHEDHTWMREFLKRWRPDQVRTPCSKWKYIWSQRTDTSNRKTMHEFEDFPGLVSAGGACGPQAFYSRALLRAWGLPAWGVRQPGHAAISRWYPEGMWGTELGHSWQNSHFPEKRYCKVAHGRPGNDMDEDGRARFNIDEESYFYSVALLEALEDCLEGWLAADIPADQYWRSLAISRRYRFATSPWKDEPLEWKNKPAKWKRPLLPDTPEKFSTDEKIEFKRGQWVIPPCTCSHPDVAATSEVYHEFKDTDFPYYPGPDYRAAHLHVMMAYTGGWIIQLGNGLKAYTEYTMPDDFPEGTYELSLKFVNVHRLQTPLQFVVTDPDGNAGEPMLMDIPYTRGEFMTGEPLIVEMKPGSKFTVKRTEGCKFNLTIHEFTLKPVEA